MTWNLISFHKHACLHLSPPTCLPLREKESRTDGADSPLTDKDPLTTICVPTQVAPPGMEPREVACDQQTDGGGWTLVLARHPPSAPRHHARHEQQIHRIGFNTSWEDYKKGFGDVRGEFWLGEAPQREFSKFTGDIGWVFETLIKSPFNTFPSLSIFKFVSFPKDQNLYNSIEDKSSPFLQVTKSFTHSHAMSRTKSTSTSPTGTETPPTPPGITSGKSLVPLFPSTAQGFSVSVGDSKKGGWRL